MKRSGVSRGIIEDAGVGEESQLPRARSAVLIGHDKREVSSFKNPREIPSSHLEYVSNDACLAKYARTVICIVVLLSPGGLLRNLILPLPDWLYGKSTMRPAA